MADERAGQAAARAIMTTDTVPKQVVAPGDGWTIGGMAKGAAMLAPNMATMLAVLTTDAAVDARRLAAHARRCRRASPSTASSSTAARAPTTPSCVLANGVAGAARPRSFAASLERGVPVACDADGP